MEGRTDYSPRKRVSILITARAHLALRRLARKKGVSMNEMIQEWIWAEDDLTGAVRISREWVRDLDIDTLERLQQYCFENHTTPAQAVTQWVWNAKVKNADIRGQMSFAK